MDLREPLWDRLAASRVHVTLGDRLALRHQGVLSAADADGLLTRQLDSLRGSIVLVRPDRFIAGAFVPTEERAFAAKLEPLLKVPATVPAPEEPALG
jgi:3-(3-hydroxy-phenyl)propionate hydroxylase